jgi:hypothetical protein
MYIEESVLKTILRHSDGSVEDNEGRIIFFGMDRFVSDICEGDCCFMCGASPKEKEFNDEHIIPKWILRKLDMYKLSITLPNDARVRYDQYTVPCCKECNTYLGAEFEKEIQVVVEGGLDSVNSYISEKGPWRIFLWLSLIFFKTHLKDSYLRKHLDRRKGEEKISSDYDWRLLHHIHCMVRAIQNGVSISNECLGTIMVLPAKKAEHIEKSDYRDVYAANTILLKVDDIAFLAVLDDSCAAMNFFSEHLKRIKGPLSPLQLREVLSHLTLLNLKLKRRPSYHTSFDATSGEIFIDAELPERMELEEHSREELGEILYSNVSDYVNKLPTPDKNFTKENVVRGAYHFLFDEKGDFMFNSMDLIEMEAE